MNSDEPPTRRESGQLAVFEQTVREAISRLATLPADDQVQELTVEAQALLAIFEGWKADPPIGQGRTHAIERVMDLHRNVEHLVAERRGG
jgi:hypothetical protein